MIEEREVSLEAREGILFTSFDVATARVVGSFESGAYETNSDEEEVGMGCP